MISKYKKDSDITLINTLYFKTKLSQETNNWEKDCMYLIYKDNKLNEKFIEKITEPKITYYLAKPDKRVNYNRLFIDKNDAVPITCKFKDVLKSIADNTGNTEFYNNNRNCGNYSANHRLHLHPDVFGSDINIDNYYRYIFSLNYTNNITPISKAYLDIESDTIDMVGDFPEMGECPINAITIIFEDNCEVYVLLLRDKNNPLITEFEKEVQSGSIFSELKDFIKDNVGGQEKLESFGLSNYNYRFAFYDDQNEIDLIIELFRLINDKKPDFVLAWNMAFDIPYIIARIIKLGYKPEDIMCHPDFDKKRADYFIDQRVINEFAERGDTAYISSYSVYLDQMIQFASRRKGQSAFQSYGLDYIGEHVARVNKLDYKEITTSLTLLPRKNYKVFVFYNIFDTIVQNCIESKVKDIDYVFSKSVINCTEYRKIHRQTVYLTNRGRIEFEKQGYIIGNNFNRGNEPPKTKFPGAFVADPTLIGDYPKMKIGDDYINVYENLDDYDFSALYPSIFREFNLAPNTQIGKIDIPNQIHDKENITNDDKWVRAGQFIEDFHSHNWIEFMHRWFGLADYLSLYDDICLYFNTIRLPNTILKPINIKTGLLNPMEFFNNSNILDPINLQKTSNNITKPMIFFSTVDQNKIKEFIDDATKNPNQQFKH